MPTNPEPTRTSRKRKAPIDDNGDPVNMNAPKKKKTAVSKEPGPPKRTFVPEKPGPSRRRPSVEMEEIQDDSRSFLSEAPHNSRNILEAADGSDNDEEHNFVPVSSPDGADRAEPEIVEEIEEDDEAELSNISIFIE